jgi:pimeloyl-ACP methyl ester carboxylesterase
MADYEDGYWWSKDGLRLHYRNYPGPADKPPILCLPGLTRNARDFAGVADDLAGRWRVIAVELRGRGESAYAKDSLSYTPLTYLQDIEALIAELGLERFVAFGTSLGGILTMLLSATGPGRIAGALLNDIGPVLEPAGLQRIRGYVGRSSNWPTWLHAARAIAENNRHAFPGYDLEDWIALAKRLCRLTPGGKIVFDYDMKIAEPFRMPGNETGMDMWPALQSLRDCPTLLVRGGLSDILSEETAREMASRLPQLEVLTLPDVGHAPTLDEPPCRAAIARLLDKVEASG